MEVTERGDPVVRATGEQHRCRDAGFAAFAAGAVTQSLPARFASTAAAHRDCLAVADASARLSYGRLDELAGRIAAAIVQRLGAGWEPVALLHGQGIASVAAILGALRAGKAYAPLEASDPPARLAAVADELGARLVLADRETADLAAAIAGPARDVLVVDDLPPCAAGPPPIDASPDAVACIYFTSGSTGRPKSVVDTHRNVLHNVLRYTNALRIAPSDRLSLLQPPSFSGTVSSTFGALLNGAALFPFALGGDRLAELAEVLRAERITVYHSVPSIFRSLVAVDGGAFPDVRVVRLEGDRASSLDVELHRRHFGAASILANGLGTTETGLCRQLRLPTTAPVDDGALPVGYAVPGVDVAVVGEDGLPLPGGRAGEIVVRGRHLALGYWRRPELTSAAFATDDEDPSLRTYRTGDLGRLRPDGCLEYLGRRDAQLKVLGQRVEPAEVEAELLRTPGVLEAAVITRAGRRGEGRLTGHVVVGPGGPDPSALRAALAERLPAHMVPSGLAVVDELPRSRTGKVDRRALAPSAADAPRGEDEARMLRLWEQVLERDGIGVEDDFFELGGDSLAAAELLAALESETGEPIAPSLLLRAPTVARLADALRDPHRRRDAPPIAALQPLGGGPPLVLVDSGDGTTTPYAALVRALGAGRAISGLAPPGGELGSVEELAAGHVEALTAADPEGPYLLGGFCFGAVVAFEMARRLRAEGRDVRHLALVGVSAFDFPCLVSPDAAARYRAAHRLVPRAGRYLARTDGRDALALLARRIRRAAAARGSRGADGRASWEAATRAAMRGYAPHRLAGRATLYLSAEETAWYTRDPAGDWDGLADDVRVRTLPCAHGSLLREPMVGELAARIRDDIAAALV
jgi:amino acid adenylation domain-containing protein